MTWYAKPSGPYHYDSAEGRANIWEMDACFNGASYEARAAIIGNSYHEGGLNPWRWQYDSQSSVSNLGYGLFQFSPGSDYLNCGWPGIAPNLSVTSVTIGADPSDGTCQCEVMGTDFLHKWVSSCWRSYWNTTTYADLYTYRQNVLNTWGNGSSVTMAQFMQCTDINAATFIFLACYEGPKIPNYEARVPTVNHIYEILTGISPVPPTPPIPPTPGPGAGVPPWLLKKIADKNRRLI